MIGIMILFLLSCVLLIQFSTDLRSLIKINNMFAMKQHDSNFITSNETDDMTFNNQVTSRIISLILPDDSVIRETKSGSLMGFTVRESGQKVSVFLGIPYARAPIGKLRFARPKPASSWKGLRDATRFGHQCIQFKPSNIHTPWINQEDDMSEDCLTLNVWSPMSDDDNNNNKGKKKTLHPVMVWFHGGAFFSGSTDLPLYDGRTFSAHGQVVVVTVNYRLGVFGFLDGKTGSSSAPGNQGLHDQVAALHWVKENIRMFDGDENQVTIFGQSAGGISVGLHYLSPLSQGLFKRGILQSGSPTVSRLFYERDPRAPDVKNKIPHLAIMTKCVKDLDEYRKTPMESIISCLKSLDTDVLISAQNHLIQELSLAFGPSAGDEFLPDLPINLLHNFANADGNANNKQSVHNISRRSVNVTESTTSSPDSEYGDDYEGADADTTGEADDTSDSDLSNSLSLSSFDASHTNFNISERTEIMMGVNADEGSYFLHYLDPHTFGYEDRNLTYQQSLAFIGKQFNFLPPHFTKLLIDLFLSPGSEMSSENNNYTDVNSIRRTLSNFIADSTFTCPATLFAQLCSSIGMRTYFYLFDHQSTVRRPTPDWMGVMHFDEVPFVFGHPVREPNLYTKQEVQFSKDIMTAWVKFARSG
jgi:carboxylesterase type B